MNWIEIDKNLNNMIKLYRDREKLYADVQLKYRWSKSQTQAALDPLIFRIDYAPNKENINVYD